MPDVKGRGFGLGFGADHHVTIDLNHEPRTGALLPEGAHKVIEDWEKRGCKEPLTALISPSALSNALYNQLLHMDSVELVKLTAAILPNMSKKSRKLLFDGLQNIPRLIMDEIRQKRIKNFDPNSYFKKLRSEHLGNPTPTVARDDITIDGVSMEITAMLLPMLYRALPGGVSPDDDKWKVTVAIAEALRKTDKDHSTHKNQEFFGPLKNANLNRIVLVDQTQEGRCTEALNNGGRSIMIKSDGATKLRFQNEVYRSSNIHFHRWRNVSAEGTHTEESVKNNAGEFETKKEFMPSPPPDYEIVGELHTIFVSENKQHALLLGAHVKIGEENPVLQNYIDALRTKANGKPLEVGTPIPFAKMPFDALSAYGAKFDADSLPEAPFKSLQLARLSINQDNEPELDSERSPGPVFYRGVRVVHLPQPITISLQQLQALQDLQPVLQKIPEQECVHPFNVHQDSALFRNKVMQAPVSWELRA